MIGRFRRYAREHGVRAAVVKSVDQARHDYFGERRITILLKELDSIQAPRKSSGLEVADLDREGLAGLSELNRERGRGRVDRRFRADFERGVHGFVGRRDGAVVGYYWWIEAERADLHSDLAWLGDTLQMQPGDAYGSDFYILPAHRPGGTANEFLFHVEGSLRDRGFARLWGYVDSGNRQARWLYSSRGYQPMGDVTVRRSPFRRQATQPAP